MVGPVDEGGRVVVDVEDVDLDHGPRHPRPAAAASTAPAAPDLDDELVAAPDLAVEPPPGGPGGRNSIDILGKVLIPSLIVRGVLRHV